MSTPTLKMARSPFSTAAFAQLARRLQHTNARYNQIASQFRCRVRPTHHAKRNAFRRGLHINTSKARACSSKHVFALPQVDVSVSVLDNIYPPAESAPVHGEYALDQEDAYMRLPPLRTLPEVVVRKARRRDGRPRVMLRLPPFKLLSNEDGRDTPYQVPVPGAPRLLPRQLPEEENGVEEMMLASASSFMDSTDSLLTPQALGSGLCITIPPRGVKRKLQDLESDENSAPSQQPKRVLRARWNELPNQ